MISRRGIRWTGSPEEPVDLASWRTGRIRDAHGSASRRHGGAPTPARPPRKGTAASGAELGDGSFDTDSPAHFFDFTLDLLGVFLGHALFDRLGTRLDEILGLFEPQGGL